MNPFLSAPPAIKVAGGPGLFDSRDAALWTRLGAQPIVPIPILTTAASKLILSQQCIFVGYSLREISGSASTQVEFINGADATGELVAEQTLQAPLPGSVGNVDVDLDASSALAAAANNVTLAGLAGATTFITGFEITGDGATASSIIAVTVTGVLGGTKTYVLTIPLGAGIALTPLQIEFSRPIPASALNTAITVNVPSFGLGNTNAAVTAHGFQRTASSTSAQTGVSVVQGLPGSGVLCRSGLFMRVITGSVIGAIYVRA